MKKVSGEYYGPKTTLETQDRNKIHLGRNSIMTVGGKMHWHQ